MLLALPAAADPIKDASRVETGTLVDDGMRKNMPHCGGMMIWTIVHFDLGPPLGKRVPVAVACIELTRKQMGPNAGNAGVLAKGKRYTLRLANHGKGSWGQVAWEAIRIDDAK